MKLSEMQDLWRDDCIVDELALDDESLKLPNLHSKYLSLWNEECLNLNRWKRDLYSMHKLKWEYYSGKMSQENLSQLNWEVFSLRILKSDVNIYIDSDLEIQDIQSKIDYTKQKISFLDSIIKGINTRGFLIKNAIEFMKFQSGS